MYLSLCPCALVLNEWNFSDLKSYFMFPIVPSLYALFSFLCGIFCNDLKVKHHFYFTLFFAQFHLKCVSFCFGVFVFLWVWFISKWTIVVYLQTSFQRRWYLVKFCEFIQKWRQLVQYCTQLNTINHKLYIIAVNWQLWTQLH